jgi:hypothetical protein
VLVPVVLVVLRVFQEEEVVVQVFMPEVVGTLDIQVLQIQVPVVLLALEQILVPVVVVLDRTLIEVVLVLVVVVCMALRLFQLFISVVEEVVVVEVVWVLVQMEEVVEELYLFLLIIFQYLVL